jgi:soluble lytic murein transglycosylase-like protein
MRIPPLFALLGIAVLVVHPSFRPGSPVVPTTAEQPALVPGPAVAQDMPAAEDWDAMPAQKAPISTAAAFAYSRHHAPTPLPALAFAALTGPAAPDADVVSDGPLAPAIDIEPGELQGFSRDSLCNAIVAVARANDLPVPFFANLIWQESNFHLGSISPAGALGIAQFMPETAVDHGVINPFEPIHALFSAGKLLRKLRAQYGNLGLAAAAYNAGPQRVNAWLAEHRGLPGETRAYVVRITGQAADRWMTGELANDPQAAVLPARAPCAEVAAEVKVEAKFARVAGLMAELSAATAPPPKMHMAAMAMKLGMPFGVPLPRPKPPQLRMLSAMKDQSRPPAAGAWVKRVAPVTPRSTFAAR